MQWGLPEPGETSPRTLWEFPRIRGTLLGVPIIRTIYSILGSILGSPSFGKLPFRSLWIWGLRFEGLRLEGLGFEGLRFEGLGFEGLGFRLSPLNPLNPLNPQIPGPQIPKSLPPHP